MNMQEVVYIFLIVGIISIIVCTIYVTYYSVKALKSITNILNNLEDAAVNAKEGIRIKVLAAVPAILLALASKLIRKRR